MATMMSAWVHRIFPIGSLITLFGALAIFAYVHVTGDGLVWQDVPDAFILVAARILN
jgi:hypothetical protein